MTPPPCVVQETAAQSACCSPDEAAKRLPACSSSLLDVDAASTGPEHAAHITCALPEVAMEGQETHAASQQLQQQGASLDQQPWHTAEAVPAQAMQPTHAQAPAAESAPDTTPPQGAGQVQACSMNSPWGHDLSRLQPGMSQVCQPFSCKGRGAGRRGRQGHQCIHSTREAAALHGAQAGPAAGRPRARPLMPMKMSRTPALLHQSCLYWCCLRRLRSGPRTWN